MSAAPAAFLVPQRVVVVLGVEYSSCCARDRVVPQLTGLGTLVQPNATSSLASRLWILVQLNLFYALQHWRVRFSCVE